MSRHGEREKTKTTNGTVFYVVVNDSCREEGERGGRKEEVKVFWRDGKDFGFPFFFLQTPFLRFGGGGFWVTKRVR